MMFHNALLLSCSSCCFNQKKECLVVCLRARAVPVTKLRSRKHSTGITNLHGFRV